jgi:uncharacterized radical SAM superfamily Fe-S cluster-containing enzyme
LQIAVVNGWNEDQLGPLVQFAVERGVFGIVFQPIMFAGRDRALPDHVRRARRYTVSQLAHDVVRQAGIDWQPSRDWFPANTFALFGYLADRLLGSHTSMVCTAAPNQVVGRPLIVHAKTRAVLPLGSLFDIEGFLADIRGIIERQIDGFDLIAALQTAIDARFEPDAAPPDFTRADLYHLLEQCIARINSTVDNWDERGYKSGEWRLMNVIVATFQDLYGFILPYLGMSTTGVATQEDEIPFCAYNSAGWREFVERTHRTATLKRMAQKPRETHNLHGQSLGSCERPDRHRQCIA